MPSISHSDRLAQLPLDELNRSLAEFLQPVTELLPDHRLIPVAHRMTQGSVTTHSPIITRMARSRARLGQTIWPTTKRSYRFLANPRFTHRTLLKRLYRIAQRTVATQRPEYGVIAMDPVNFDKPYTHTVEGVRRVMNDTPPCWGHPKRVTRGDPAITATIVNLAQPSTTYAHWFSYETVEFISQNREIERAFPITHTLFPSPKLRFVGDAGLEDPKIFAHVERVHAEFVIRACHDRQVEVYHDRLRRWEAATLVDLVATVPFQFDPDVQFTHARPVRIVRTGFGWFNIRVVETQPVLWGVIAHHFVEDHDLILLTNVPLHNAAVVRQVYGDWRQRGNSAHGYRFDQEEGLAVEDMRVETLEHLRRLFVLVWLAAQFVYSMGRTWTHLAVRWLRHWGGKLGLNGDRDGPYVLLECRCDGARTVLFLPR